jgi:hypothetical protein
MLFMYLRRYLGTAKPQKKKPAVSQEVQGIDAQVVNPFDRQMFPNKINFAAKDGAKSQTAPMKSCQSVRKREDRR